MAECGPWKNIENTRSLDGGQYSFEVFRAQAMQLTTGAPYCFRLDTRYTSGVLASATMEALFGEAQIPPMPDWTPDLRVDGGVFVFAPYRTRSPDVEFFVIQHVLEIRRGSQVSWRAADASLLTLGLETQPISADPRIVNEFGGNARLRVSYTEGEGQQSPIGELVVRPRVEASSARTLSLSDTVDARSRHSLCDFFSMSCPLTDGFLVSADLDGHPWMQVNFMQPFAPSLVVVRSLVVNGPTLEVSGIQVDGGVLPLGAFALTRELDGPGSLEPNGVYLPAPTFVAMTVDAGEPVVSLRVTAEGLVKVDEVSIY